MPYNCPTCKTEVKNKSDCICCDKCNKWFHFKCSKLRKSEFDIYCLDNSFEWLCENCSNDCCKKCDIIFRKNANAISCDLCDEWFHLKCSGLNKDIFKKLAESDDEWYCTPCKSFIFPFNSIDSNKLTSLGFNSIHNKDHENKLRTLFLPNTTVQVSCLDYKHDCSVCTNLIKNPRVLRSSIPCPSCKHMIHKKCSSLNSSQLSSLKSTTNIWECPRCTKMKFPFSELEDEEIYLCSFNSNWSCNCGNKQPVPLYKDKYNLKSLFNKIDKILENKKKLKSLDNRYFCDFLDGVKGALS